jgi:hypothetical protein
MSINKKFEEMLERLVNEDRNGAAELFHDIVVEKSREIYQGLLESEFEEDFDLETFEVEGDDDEIGGDPSDDFIDDTESDMDDEGDMDDIGDDEGDEGEVEDRVEDLEDAFEQLKAEFEELLDKDSGDEEGDMDDMGDAEDDMDDMGDAEDDMGDEEEDEFPAKKSATEQMREYVEKIGGDSYEKFAKGGDNGTQTKSTVASKNDMGGTAKNLNQSQANEKGRATPSSKPMNTGNVNVPGGKASKSMKSTPKPAGKESGAHTKSTIGSK